MSPPTTRRSAASSVFSSSQLVPTGQITIIRRFIFRNGPFGAVLFVLAATLANHVRRVLVPWLGQFIWWHAIENMKLARSSPHYFVEESLSFTWSEVLFWVCCTVIGCFVLTGIQNGLVSEEGTSSHQKDTSSTPLLALDGEREVALGIHDMLCMAMSLTLMEGYYTQACFSAAYMYALSRLVVYGGAVERAFLWSCISERWLHAVFQCGLVLYWAYVHFLPTARSIARATGAGKPAMGMVHGIIWGGTAYLVRYSNKYFLFLELSDMLVTLGWMALGLVTVLLLKLETVLGWRDAKERDIQVR
ncbi:hypothetical protein X797_002275 [Metarhizium robertsii]|uniref:Uncharacterized protein n=1 Tax=Metarhizium robertsii TaxID=568076 RepID=A0A0A1V339_9HYPO|nr:hypothetical protein X797_002275 [Metarhizium robertsii]